MSLVGLHKADGFFRKLPYLGYYENHTTKWMTMWSDETMAVEVGFKNLGFLGF